MRGGGTVGVALALLFADGVSLAQSIAVEAPDSCPATELRATDGALRGTIKIRIVAEAGSFLGEISFPGQDVMARRVEGSQCETVVRALALILRLGMQEMRAKAEPTDTAVSAAMVQPRPIIVDAEAPRFLQRPEDDQPTGLRYGLELAGGGRQLGRFLGPGARLALFLGGTRAWGTLAVSTSTQSVAVQMGEARFRLLAGSLSACGRGFVDVCAGVEAGLLKAETNDIEQTSTMATYWLAPSISLERTVAVNHDLSIGARGLVSFPLNRPRFQVDPNIEVLDTGLVSATAEIFLRWGIN